MKHGDALIATALVITVGSAYFLWKRRGESAIRSKDHQEPYSNFNHPEKFLLDKLVSSIVPLLLPLADLAKHPSHNYKNHGMKKAIGALRENNKLDDDGYKKECKAWNTLIQQKNSTDYLITGLVTIPRNFKVLSQYGVPNAEELEQLSDPEDTASEVEISIACPASALEGGFELVDGKDDLKTNGFRQMKPCKLEDLKFAPSAQLLLWFHGGGLSLGQARDGHFSIGYAKTLSEKYAKTDIIEDDSAAPLVLLSVQYRLAPENPFPAAVIDGLSSASFLIEKYPSLALHVAGISAGGNLSAVVGIEAHRKYPGKVKSIVANIPMFQPRSDSLLYHLNSKSSGTCPTEFVRWCWSAYLQLDEKKTGDIDFYSSDGLKSALEKSKWSKYMDSSSSERAPASCWRLICPQVDLPPNLDNDNAPKIIVVTATADPLHDDGVDFVKSLRKEYGKRSDKVLHIESGGSHVLSLMFDKKASEDYMAAWSMVMWGSS